MSGSPTYVVTQASYDSLGRGQCVAQRMNPSEFGALPSDACTLDTQGSYGPDRIARATYDAANRVELVQTGYGVTGVEANDVATAYTGNGRLSHVTDAEGNRTTYEYDGHDRLLNTRFPSPTTDGVSAPTSGTGADYEQLGYDAGSNVVSRRLRDGTSIGYSYDALGRLAGRDLPATAWYNLDRAFAYDNLGRLTFADGNSAFTFAYDALGRLVSETGPFGTTGYQYDLAGRRTRLTWTDGFYVAYDYLVTGEITAIRENGATSGAGVLGTYAYDDLGRRTSLTRGNGTVTGYGYDAVSRLSQLTEDLAGTGHDLTLGFSHNPASQIVENTRSNDAYAWAGHYAVDRDYTANGRNQVTAAGAVTPAYDGRGNLTAAGGPTYAYTANNRLATSSGGTYREMMDDSLDRLFRYYDGSANRWLVYDGQSLIAEHGSGGALLRRFVHGPGMDEPLVWYEVSGSTSDRSWLHADERGSIIAVSNGSGAVTNVNTYDEYGIPASGNAGRFQYTGQQWLAEFGMQYSRARIYSPTLGRFLQTDPIGYGGGMNLHAYVGNDPVNLTDPSGLGPDDPPCDDCSGDIEVIGPDNGPGGWGRIGSGTRIVPRTVTEYGGGGDAPRQEPNPEETPTCRAIREQVNATRNNLSTSITNTQRWDRIDLLRNDLTTAQLNEADARDLQGLVYILTGTGGLAGARTAIPRPGPWGFVAAFVGGVLGTEGLGAIAEMHRNEIAAIEARMAQLQAQADGTCP